MIALTADELAQVTGATAVGAGDEAKSGRRGVLDLVLAGAVRIDSRDVEAGDLFVALPGARVDGHDFLGEAFERGALAALVQRPVPGAPGPQLLVDDVRQALTRLAADQAARRPSSTRVIGITGSSGKTTTKDLLAQVLEQHGPTIAPPGSFNNEIGLPLTVLRATEHTRFLVLEMGARGIGHIAELMRIARPQVGVALNVGSAHVGEFGGADAIAQAKGEIVEGLPGEGTAVLNADDPRTRAMASRTSARVVLFGESASAAVRAENVHLDPSGCARFTLVIRDDHAEVALRMPGRHMVSNALAAAAVAHDCGLAVVEIGRGLSAAEPRSRWRMETTTRADDVVIINDAYNANPESVLAALSVLGARECAGRRIAVLGEMLELGDIALAEHERIGTATGASGVEVLVAVGRDAIVDALARGARSAGVEVRTASGVEDAAQRLDDLRSGDAVLIKASRSIGLEQLADVLLRHDVPAVKNGVST